MEQQTNHKQTWLKYVELWVCLKIGYLGIPNFNEISSADHHFVIEKQHFQTHIFVPLLKIKGRLPVSIA